LLTAAGAVGRALGIEIRPPARSETIERVKEPIEAIARASKVRMRRVLLTGNWWRKDCGPLLAYTLCDNQPVALLPTSATRYELFDPVNLTRTPVDRTIQSQLAPEAYTFYRSLPQTALTALDVLKFGLKGHMSDLGIVFLAGIIITLIEMLTPQATATIIDSAIPGSDRGLLLQIGLGLFAVAIAAAVFHLVQGFAMLRAETLIDSSTQAALWDRLLNLNSPFFRAYSTGDLQSRVSAISKIHQTLSGTTLSTLFSSFFSLLNLALLLYYNAPLALIAVLVVLTIVAYSTAVGAINLRNVRSLERLRGKILGLTVQLISGVTKLRVAAAETRAFAYWSQQYTQQQKLVLRTEKFENNLAVFNELLPLISSMLIFTFTVLATQQTSGLSIGTFLAFNAAFGSFMAGATSLSNSVMNILSIVAFWELAKPILEAKPEVDEYKADPGKLSGKLLVERVTFRYSDDGPITLENVSLSAKPGEFIALVGPSGSGKSTIFRLLLGFETPESGEVYYDNQALAGLDVLAVRRQLGVVLQQSQVLSTSIFENIAGNALVTMDEAWEAARHAGFAEDITRMPMGMHTVISEGGTNLSGGQKQRLLIARALALKPKILLFDEATSALDNRTQAIISESLDKLKVTRVVVAHRLSTIRNADHIYVLDCGRVVQQGCFQELAEQEGLFARLMARQIS
jgi:ATP-binding cassette subfamily C protein